MGTLSFAPTASATSTRMRKASSFPPPPVYIPTPTLEIICRSYFPTKDPNHEEVDEDVEDGKDEEPMVQLLKTTAAA